MRSVSMDPVINNTNYSNFYPFHKKGIPNDKAVLFSIIFKEHWMY